MTALVLTLLLAQVPDAGAHHDAGARATVTRKKPVDAGIFIDAGFLLDAGFIEADAGFEADAGETLDAGSEPVPPPPEVIDAELGEADPVPAMAPVVDAGVEVAPMLAPPPFLVRQVRIAAIQALVGRFTANTCQRPVAESPFERVSARIDGARQVKGSAPLIFDAGDLLGTSAIGRLAVDTDVGKLAEAIAALGLKGRALGHRDLAGSRQRLLELTQALDAVGLRTTLTNLQCSTEAMPLCDAVISASDPPLLVDSPDGRVGFVAAISPSTLRQVAKNLGQGLTLLPPAEALADATKRARAMGATRVVAVYDPAIGTELEDAIALAQHIDPANSPDVIFVAGVADRLRSALSAGGNTMLVATRPTEVVTVELRDARQHAVDVPAPGTTDPAIAEYARQLNQTLCQQYEKPLAGSTLKREVDRETAAAFVLDVMREHSKAEVAVINKPAISPNAPWPVRTALSPLDLMQVLPFDNGMRTVQLKGAALNTFFSSANAQDYYIRGATNENGAWRINGRAIDLLQNYKLVTTDFVVDKSGTDFQPTGLADAEQVQGGTVREVVTGWLGVPRTGDILTQPIDPAQRARWTLTYRLQLDLTSVTVANPNQAIFTDTQLARGQSFSLVGETEFRAIGDHPAYSLENQLRLRYGVLNTTDLTGVTTGAVNNVDIATGRVLAYARQLFGASNWYVPRPYVDFSAESEITRPDTRSYHHLQLLPTAGVRLELSPTFQLYVGGGATWEVFARTEDLTPPVPPGAAVLVAGWQLRPTKLVQLGTRWLEAESNLDFFVRDLSGPTQAQARGRVRIFFPLFSVFSLTATYDLFLRSVRLRDDSGGWATSVGVSNDVYLGLQVAFGQAFQTFAF